MTDITELAQLARIHFVSSYPGNDWETGSHDVAPAGRRPNIVPRGRTYIVDLLNVRGDVVLKGGRFQVGSGLTHDDRGREIAPTVDQVLESFWMDASLAQGTFDDFCADLGYDTDSRKALNSYLACQEIASQLNAGFTPGERVRIQQIIDNQE